MVGRVPGREWGPRALGLDGEEKGAGPGLWQLTQFPSVCMPCPQVDTQEWSHVPACAHTHSDKG